MFSEWGQGGRGFSAAGPGAMAEKQAVQKEKKKKKTEERKMCVVIFKKPISYCRFVSADTKGADVHIHSVPTLVISLSPAPQKRIAGGEAWAWVSSCPLFLPEAYVFLLCQAWGHPALVLHSSQAHAQLGTRKGGHRVTVDGEGESC